jgi:signal transduction histidine kinase
MPDMTGTELLEVVATEYPDIRRFLLTAFTDFETVVEAVNKGHIHGYVNKPLQADEVRLSINNSLEMYDLRMKNRQMMAELETVNKELMNLDGLKSEIIKVISQEIRNPLNRIMGTLHLLKDKIEGQELSEVVNILDSSVSRLEEFSSMTEQISILKSPGHELNITDVPLKRVIEYSIIEASEEMKEKEIDLDLRIESEDTLVQGESHLLVSCLVNLIRHAVEHSGEGTGITIRTYDSENEISCEVIDQGKDYSDQLFEDLSNQFSAGLKKLNLNLGIELGLAQMIMEAHNGYVEFEKTDDNKGAVKMIFPQDIEPPSE